MPVKRADIKQVDNGYTVESSHYSDSSQVYRSLVEVFEYLLHFFEGAYVMEVVIRKKEVGDEE